ncbi:hypothetical protein LIER_33452 [Lithospermum erythrorhizon]|uniref:Uncharacterized protein n=1 Tax=Lithospermum erythrorhizon TaxID=34254 RepID=A0AAV3RZ08_LITER
MNLKLGQHISKWMAFRARVRALKAIYVVEIIDPNNNTFPLAYALVEIENKETREWFRKHLSEEIMIVSNDDGSSEVTEEGWTFMSDKKKPMTGPNLWPQTSSVAPHPPPMTKRKLARQGGLEE